MKKGLIYVNFMLAFSYACAMISTVDWLDQMAGIPSLDVTGIWDGGDRMGGGWGEGRFIQEGNKFWGTLGFYDVHGSVNGKDVYMVLSSGNQLYYISKLTVDKEGNLFGKAMYKIFSFDFYDSYNFEKTESAYTYLIMLNKVKK